MDRAKILVVDDESRMRKLVRDFLVREGYNVLEAEDGVEAMDIFYEEKDISLLSSILASLNFIVLSIPVNNARQPFVVSMASNTSSLSSCISLLYASGIPFIVVRSDINAP